MNIDDKINTISEAHKNGSLVSVKDNKIFDVILDLFQDISDEIDELNKVMYF